MVGSFAIFFVWIISNVSIQSYAWILLGNSNNDNINYNPFNSPSPSPPRHADSSSSSLMMYISSSSSSVSQHLLSITKKRLSIHHGLFVIHPHKSNRYHSQNKIRSSSSYYTTIPQRDRIFMNQGNNDDGGHNSPLSPWLIESSALVSTLTRLNQKWESSSSTTSSSSNSKGRPEWRKLFLTESSTSTTSSYDSKQQEQQQQQQPMEDESYNSKFVYLMEPLNNQKPTMIILFTGGAILGQTPHIAYSFLLENLSMNLNATIITSPYTISLDHWSLAQQTLTSYKQALLCYEKGKYLNEDDESSLSTTIPIFTLSHSLGAKLLILALVASSTFESLITGHLFLCFNNFGFSQTISMIKVFTQTFQQEQQQQQDQTQSSTSSFDTSTSWFDRILDVTKQAMDMVGLEFTPNPQETYQIISKKFTQHIQLKSSIFIMDNDTLDSSTMLIQSCQDNNYIKEEEEKKKKNKDKNKYISTTTLPGTHLTPVFLQVDLNDLNNNPNRMMDGEFVSSILGGFRGASFGNENQTRTLIQEISKSIQSRIMSHEMNSIVDI